MSAFRISADRLEIESCRYKKYHQEWIVVLCTPDNKIHICDEFQAVIVWEQLKVKIYSKFSKSFKREHYILYTPPALR